MLPSPSTASKKVDLTFPHTEAVTPGHIKIHLFIRDKLRWSEGNKFSWNYICVASISRLFTSLFSSPFWNIICARYFRPIYVTSLSRKTFCPAFSPSNRVHKTKLGSVTLKQYFEIGFWIELWWKWKCWYRQTWSMVKCGKWSIPTSIDSPRQDLLSQSWTLMT